MKSFIFYLIAGLIVFVTLFLTIDFITATSKYGVGLVIFAKYYTYYTFEILSQLAPVACLLSTLFTLGTLNKNSELVAMFSMGMSLFRVSLPVIIGTVLFSIGLFVFSNQFITQLVDKKNYIFYVEMKKKPHMYSTSKQENIWYRSGQNIFNINLLNAKEERATGITVYTFSSGWTLQQILAAKEAEVKTGLWTLKEGRVTVFFDSFATPVTEEFKERTLAVGEDVIDIRSSSRASSSMSVGELRRYISRNKEAGLNTTPFEVDYYAKYSFAFTSLVMVLLGVSFSIGSSPRSGGILMNLQKCILVTIGYWVVYSSGLTLGKYGAIPPFLAAWGPNILMSFLAVFLIWRQKK
ncbi:MAG: LPS export ABC transporter permease LptG [Bdellovibrionaceae bacterium]|nr:LPS export ABC transporter permease LptG [Pseudobdellovibrionaceae bacterium]